MRHCRCQRSFRATLFREVVFGRFAAAIAFRSRNRRTDTDLQASRPDGGCSIGVQVVALALEEVRQMPDDLFHPADKLNVLVH